MIDLNDIIRYYSILTAKCPINSLGPPFSYYLTDELESNLLCHNLYQIDLKQAFPTICQILFGKDHPFIINIHNIKDKLQRNIFISTTLTEQSKKDGKNYLQELNLYSKIMVLGYVYSKFKDIIIIEYQKDGVLFKGEEWSIEETEFLSFINQNNIQFHKNNIDIYIRFNKTSIYNQNSDLEIKGKYKNIPTNVHNIINEFVKGNIYNIDTDNKIIYFSKLYLDILLKTNSLDLIKKYFGFIDNDSIKYLDNNGELTSSISNLNSFSYLKYIIFPILVLFRKDKQRKQ